MQTDGVSAFDTSYLDGNRRNPHSQHRHRQLSVPAELRFLGQEPLTHCCCWFNVSLITAVRAIATFEGFWAFVSIVDLLSEEQPEELYSDTASGMVLAILALCGGPACLLGLDCVEKLDARLIKYYFRWFFMNVLVVSFMLPFQLIESCQVSSNVSMDDKSANSSNGEPPGRMIEDEEPCETILSDIIMVTTVYMIVGLYLSWVIYSLYARVLVGQLDICRYGYRAAAFSSPSRQDPNSFRNLYTPAATDAHPNVASLQSDTNIRVQPNTV